MLNSLIIDFFLIINALIYKFIIAIIGYCHFYYQLGYGLVFYIYIFRKNKKKPAFFGKSFLNWMFFNINVYNKTLLSKDFIIFLKNLAKKNFIFGFFTFTRFSKQNLSINNLYQWLTIFYKTRTVAWTPIFKRSSYIAFVSFLKRFVRKK